MKILISFIPSVFPVQNHGGSTKILKELVRYLAIHGDKITIVCNERFDNKKEYTLYPNVIVKPIYKFRETYPNPYNTAPFRLAENINILYQLSKQHDLLFIFDTDFIFTDMFKHIPILYSLRDYVYPEALQGSFLIRNGEIIVNSQFVHDSFLATAGRFYPGLKKRIHLVQNGVDTSVLRKEKTAEIKKIINISPNSHPILLYPHRPGPGKGIYESLDVIEKLVKKYKLDQTKLLIPRGIDEQVDSQVRIFYDQILNTAKILGIEENIIFHPWIPPYLMPNYYALGDVTLCLGNIVEAFSNTTLESLKYETPVIAAKVACYRTFLPDWCLNKVDYNDSETTAQIIVNIINKKNQKDIKNISNFINNEFSMEVMCKKYQYIIHHQKILEPVKYESNTMQINSKDIYQLSPWCSLSNKKIYNDYLNRYFINERLIDVFTKLKKLSFSYNEVVRYNIKKEFLKKQLSEGFLIKTDYIK